MKYKNIVSASFISRPNRFIAIVSLNGEIVSVHMNNTGRCKELLVPHTMVYLEDFGSNMGKRKYQYELRSVVKKTPYGDLIINIDSLAPNKVVKEALEDGVLSLPKMEKLSFIKPECVYKDSRFDFYVKDCVGQEAYIEVKGVTLETHFNCFFPDAPTERGLKHVNELIQLSELGIKTYLILVIQMEGIKTFSPNWETHRAFGLALQEAEKKGVKILPIGCNVSSTSIVLNPHYTVPLLLENSNE
ncbi:MAG: DNA/RNA nuclease SfsA [Sphaerochaetaceae bacterium]|nr:DNA/RNA nuclease SfsA [Sphaerochaetaceae bacterium]